MIPMRLNKDLNFDQVYTWPLAGQKSFILILRNIYICHNDYSNLQIILGLLKCAFLKNDFIYKYTFGELNIFRHQNMVGYCTHLILMTGYVELTRGAFLMKLFLRNANFSSLFFQFSQISMFSRDLKNKANIDEIVHCGNNNITKQKKTD